MTGCMAHEHITAFGPNVATMAVRQKLTELVVPQLQRLREQFGCNTLVECTCVPSYGRDPETYAMVARQAGFHVIASTGFYCRLHNPYWMQHASIQQLVTYWQEEVENGMDGTTVKPGILKASLTPDALDDNDHYALYERWHEALAVVHHETGLPITTHSGGPILSRHLEMLTRHGVAPEAVVLGHAANDGKMEYWLPVLEQGAFVLVNFCQCFRPPMYQRDLDLIKGAIDHGFAGQVLLSVDMMPKPDKGGMDLVVDNYGQSFLDIYTRAVPDLKKMGVTDEQIQQMLSDNPRRHMAAG